MPQFTPKLAQAVATAGSGLPANVIVMRPERWAWLENGRAGSTNTGLAVLPAQPGDPPTAVGRVLGCPVVLDANLPENLGAATNHDVVLVARTDAVVLRESKPKLLALPQKGLTVRLVALVYAGLVPRWPGSLAVVSGTGLTAPVFT